MSNLWAALLGTDKGSYPIEIEGQTVLVNALDEQRFDRLAGKHPFGLTARDGDRLCEGGVVWARLSGTRSLEQVRSFYRPPTVLFTKGAKGVALWAVRPHRNIWDANERLARTFKGRIKDADPWLFRLDIKGHKQEWRMDAYYHLDELVSRCAS
ncbi:MAG: hypothetical protein EBS90_13505 [Betaproteobacteria bacterium]|nr:hypothetical protein [Betaproteobacteria bacterium]